MTDYDRTPTSTNNAGGFVIGGIICAVVALFIAPIIFGPIGAVLGFVAYGKGDKRGLWVGIAAIVATVAGMVLGAMILNSRA